MKYATPGRGVKALVAFVLILPVLLSLGYFFPLKGYRINAELSPEAPLAAELSIRTVRPALISVAVSSLDGEEIQREGVREEERTGLEIRNGGGRGGGRSGGRSGGRIYRRVQTVPVLGLYPDHENRIHLELHYRNGAVRRTSLNIRTEPLPDDFPDVTVVTHHAELVQEGVTFLNLGRYNDDREYLSQPAAVDRYDRVRWYLPDGTRHLLRRMKDGTLLIQRGETLLTIDMLGRPTGARWNAPEGIHHDAIEIPGGNLLVLTSAPGSFEDGVVELDRESGEVTGSWDFRNLLDQRRPRQPINLADEDWLHLNGIAWDDQSFIVSGRDQSAVVKVNHMSGNVEWILGNPDHWKEPYRSLLLEPLGAPFEWSWGQHAPEVDPRGPPRPLVRILVYDNGNHRSYDTPLPPHESYSRAVEYEINEEEGTVRQLWQYGKERGSELYTPFIGDADYLPNGNRLITFGGISRNRKGEPIELFDLDTMEVNPMKISAHIVETTAENPARVVQEFIFEDSDRESWRGYRIYRAERMELYPQPVTAAKRSQASR